MKRFRDESGFTLIELLVALPMLTIVLGGLTVTMLKLNSTSKQQQELATLQTEARSQLETMETDIREAFVGDGTGPITAASATSITFLSPDRYPMAISGGTASSFHLRRITYSVTGGSLTKQVTTSTNTFPNGPPWSWPAQSGATTTVLGEVSNTDNFTFYTSDGIQSNPDVPLTFPITDTYGIVAVRIKLTETVQGPNPASFTLNGLVSMRDPYG